MEDLVLPLSGKSGLLGAGEELQQNVIISRGDVLVGGLQEEKRLGEREWARKFQMACSRRQRWGEFAAQGRQRAKAHQQSIAGNLAQMKGQKPCTAEEKRREKKELEKDLVARHAERYEQSKRVSMRGVTDSLVSDSSGVAESSQDIPLLQRLKEANSSSAKARALLRRDLNRRGSDREPRREQSTSSLRVDQTLGKTR